MTWWCSASTLRWTWHFTAYPGAWIIDLALAYTYWRFARHAATTRGARAAGWMGIALLAISFDWPLGPLAAGYLASAHAVQFLIVALIAPPLVLIGARGGIAAAWPTDDARASALRRVFNPLLGAIIFNVVVVATHVPRVNDMLMPLQFGAFAVDMGWLAAGTLFWWPLIVSVPHRPLFAVPLKMVYLFLGTLAHSGIAIVMLVRDHPMYGVYELAPRVVNLSAMDDLQIAGGIMELGGAAIIFGVLTAMFFRWTGGTGAERP